MNNVTKIFECEVCGNTKLQPVLNLGEHPLCDDLKPIGSSEDCQNYPINILFCNNCKTAHQEYQIAKHQLFPQEYHYRARFTKDVLNGMQDLVQSTVLQLGDLQNKKVLDIGSNDGSLLNFFKQQKAICIGVEPTAAALESSPDLDKIFNRFFDQDLAQEIFDQYGYMDVITFTNVFAHIEDLNALIAALRLLINEKTLLVIENHYLDKILEKNQFDTFYHEHPRTYSATSFISIAKKLGMQVHDLAFPGRYGGNIRIMFKQNSNKEIPLLQQVLDKEEESIAKFEQMNNFIETWRQAKRQEIMDLKANHKHIYAKAFPARAAILIRLLGLDADDINGVFEQDKSKKVGHLVPGTKIPILQDSKIFEIMPTVIINLAWHLKSEIEQYLRNSKYAGEIRHIL